MELDIFAIGAAVLSLLSCLTLVSTVPPRGWSFVEWVLLVVIGVLITIALCFCGALVAGRRRREQDETVLTLGVAGSWVWIVAFVCGLLGARVSLIELVVCVGVVGAMFTSAAVGWSIGVPPPQLWWSCRGCGYNLKGLPAEAECPECGRKRGVYRPPTPTTFDDLGK